MNTYLVAIDRWVELLGDRQVMDIKWLKNSLQNSYTSLTW
jgi:hypothetical protein